MAKHGLGIGDRLAKIGYRTYAEYLASDHWKAMHRRYRASGRPQRCLGCGNPNYQLHHRSYSRLGNELLGDLIPLCRGCHTRVHEYLELTGTNIQHTHAALRHLFGWTRKQTRKKFAPFNSPKRKGGMGWVPRPYD